MNNRIRGMRPSYVDGHVAQWTLNVGQSIVEMSEKNEKAFYNEDIFYFQFKYEILELTAVEYYGMKPMGVAVCLSCYCKIVSMNLHVKLMQQSNHNHEPIDRYSLSWIGFVDWSKKKL